ncbi:MAG: helicase C-terminal domain-containing protein, partial [Candidatus Korarchaeum sp.]|nr:helicase C-terminal domain-containing protein [Candidatus Korarchaeum sp.]
MMHFPYAPRKHQKEVMEAIRRAAEKGEHFCLHAPTGFGKTPVVLSALLDAAEGESKIIWAVRTGNETDRPIEELKVISKRKEVFGISFRGKKDMCLLARRMRISSNEGVSNLCRMKRESCPYLRNLRKNEGIELKDPISFSEVLEIASRLNFCPYFLQISLLDEATVISLSYNYVLSPLGWAVRHKVRFGDSFLVVDEAHNIDRVAKELNSKSISLVSVERALKEDEKYDLKDSLGLRRKIASLRDFMVSIAKEEDGTFSLEEMLSSTGFEPEDLKKLYELINTVYSDQVRRGKEPRSYLNSVADFLLTALEKAGEEGVVYLYSKEDGLSLEVWDMRAREILQSIWSDFRAVVFMSGTLEPINAFAETVGLKEFSKMSVPSIADPERVSTVIVKGVSTKGEELSAEMVRRYLRVVESFLELSGNLAIFTASYRVQEKVLDGIRDLATESGRRIFVEERGISGDEASNMLRDFKSLPKFGKEGLLIAPAGGRFAEGADFPGRELEGVMLLGVPFDRLTTKTKLQIEYNERILREEEGKVLSLRCPSPE